MSSSADDICKDLIKTYDTTAIEELTPELRHAFRFFAAQCTTLSRPVLSRLINNYYSPSNKPITKFIGGPKNLTVHYSAYFGKLIYIFGEFHQNKMDCTNFPETAALSGEPNNFMTIDDYMVQLYTNTDKFIDFFIEIPTFGKKQPGYSNTGFTIGGSNFRLNHLFQKFRTCISPNTRNDVACQLGRTHFFDVRYINFISTDHISLVATKFKGAGIDENKIEETLKSIEVHDILSYIESCFYYSDTKERLKEYFTNIIYKNIYNSTPLFKMKDYDNKLSGYIMNFINHEINEKIEKNYQNLQQNNHVLLEYNKKTVTAHIIRSFVSLVNFFTSIACISVDLYLITRVFKEFNISRQASAGAFPNDQPNEANNIVIYTGDNHAQRYRRFLNLCGFEVVGKTGKSEKGKDTDTCINMKYIHQPFFSEASKTKMDVPIFEDYIFDYDNTYDDEQYLYDFFLRSIQNKN